MVGVGVGWWARGRAGARARGRVGAGAGGEAGPSLFEERIFERKGRLRVGAARQRRAHAAVQRRGLGRRGARR